jgi:hypothetical protein
VQLLRANHPEEAARLSAMTLEERYHANYLTKHGLPLPPWTYEPTEEQTEQLIRVYGRDTKKHIRVGASATQSEEEHANGI